MNTVEQLQQLLALATHPKTNEDEAANAGEKLTRNLHKLRAAGATDLTLVLVPDRVAAKLAGNGDTPTVGEMVDAAKPIVDGIFNLLDTLKGKKR